MWRNILNIQDNFNLSDSEIAEICCMSHKKFLNYKSLRRPMEVPHVFNFCQHFWLDPKKFTFDEICSETLYDHEQGNYKTVSKKYRHKAHSKIFTLQTILRLAETRGVEENLLKSLQISPKILNDPSQSISVHLLADAVQELGGHFSQGDFYRIGKLNAFALADGDFGRSLKNSRSFVELFDHWSSVVHMIEKNWSYRIKKANMREIVIESFPNEELCEEYKTKKYSNYTFTLFRAGFASALTNYIGYEDSHVHLSKSIHHDDPHCEFTIQFSPKKMTGPTIRAV